MSSRRVERGDDANVKSAAKEPDGQTPPEMTGARSIFANAASLMISRLAVAAMGWAGTLLIVRHLSLADWGKFSFVFGLLGMMAVITNMANPRVIFGQLARDDGSLAGSYVLLRLALGLLAYVVALSFETVGHYPTVVLRATLIAGLVVVIANCSSGYDVIFQYRMQLSKVAVASVLGQAAQLGLTIVLALVHSSLVIFTVPAVLCEVVASAWRLYRLPKHPALHYTFNWRHWMELIKLSIPLALGGALTVMYYSLDTVMLSKMQTFAAVGIYGIAYKFAGIVAVVGTGLSRALLPVLVRYWPEEAEHFRAVLRRTTRLLLVLGALITFEFMIFATNAIGLLYGHHYVVGAGAARLVVASECVGFFETLAVTTLISVNRNKFFVVAALAGLLVNLGVNLLVIPRWSYMGAAWATLLTEVVVLVVMWVPLARAVGSNCFEIGVIARVLFSSGIAVGAAVGIGKVGPWPAAAAIGAAVYVLALVVTQVGGRGRALESLRSLVKLDRIET